MTTLLSPTDNAYQKAIQYFLAIIMILIIGKLISLIPVMSRLQLAGTYKVAQIVWFSAKLSVLILFYFFARYSLAVLPNTGAILSFFRNIVEPLTVLIIVIIGQELLWQLLEPFVQTTGKKIYFSLAILLIVTISILLVLRAYQSALYLLNAGPEITKYLSRLVPISYKICTACSKKVMENAIFCSYCGYKLEEDSSCSKCREILLADEKFCRHCGTEVKEN